MADRAQPGPVVMAETAFQRLKTGAEQLATLTFQEAATASGVFLDGKTALTTVERRGKNGKGTLGGNLEHHTVVQPGRQYPARLGNRPPARTAAKTNTHRAGAGRGRRETMGKSLEASRGAAGHPTTLLQKL